MKRIETHLMVQFISFKSFFPERAVSHSAAFKVSRVKGTLRWSINFYCPLNKHFIPVQEQLEMSIHQERNNVVKKNPKPNTQNNPKQKKTLKMRDNPSFLCQQISENTGCAEWSNSSNVSL